MIREVFALHFGGAWENVPLPPCTSTVGCNWVYTVKVGPDGQIDPKGTTSHQELYTDF